FLIVSAEDELMTATPFLVNVLEEVSLDLSRIWALVTTLPAGLKNVVSQSREHQRQRRYALLPVNEQPPGEARCAVSRRDVHNGPEEMAASGLVARDHEDILPQVLALGLAPSVVALEDRDDELCGSVDDFREWTVDGFHGHLPSIRQCFQQGLSRV